MSEAKDDGVKCDKELFFRKYYKLKRVSESIDMDFRRIYEQSTKPRFENTDINLLDRSSLYESDVMLLCQGGKKMHCHHAFLRYWCPALYTELQNGCPVHNVPDIKREELLLFMDIAYPTGAEVNSKYMYHYWKCSIV